MNKVEIIEAISSIKSVADLNEISASIQQQLSEIKDEMFPGARQQISEFIGMFGYAALGLIKPKTNAADGRPRIPKFRNPAGKETWTGSGGRPKWIGDRDVNDFLNPEWIAADAAKKELKKSSKDKSVKAANTEVQSPVVTEKPLPDEIQLEKSSPMTPVHTQVIGTTTQPITLRPISDDTAEIMRMDLSVSMPTHDEALHSS